MAATELSLADRIAAALVAADRCYQAASDVRELLGNCPEPELESLRRQLTTVMADLESARHAAYQAVRAIVGTLGGT